MEENSGISKEEQERLLVEYQAAQNSAQHHDHILWIMNGAALGASGLLMRLLFTSNMLYGLYENALMIIVTYILGIGLLIGAGISTCLLAGLKRDRYTRCIAIEEKLGLHLHSQTKWPKGIMGVFYYSALGLFIVMWVIIVSSTLRH